MTREERERRELAAMKQFPAEFKKFMDETKLAISMEDSFMEQKEHLDYKVTMHDLLYCSA